MDKYKVFSKWWFLVLLLVTFVAGCGGKAKDAEPPKAFTSYSLGGVAGTINETAKSIAVTMPYSTDATHLVATFTTTGTGVKVGALAQTSGTTANNFTAPVAYLVTASDNTTALYTVTLTIAPNSAKAITAYAFVGLTGAAGVINEPAKSIAVTVPFGTVVTNLVATFTTSGEAVKAGILAQTSGITPNNFTVPAVYTVTAADNSTAAYTVNVTIATNPAKAITAYSFVGFTGFAGTINEPAKSIAVNLPFGTNPTNLTAAFTTTGAAVAVGSIVQTSSTTANDFTAPVSYKVTAADGLTATYTVNVTIAPNPAKAITAYAFAGFTAAPGSINEQTKTITVTLPFGTNVTNLVATFTATGPAVMVGTSVQTSSATVNNFTTPVVYIVTAADASTAAYTVNVIIAPNPAKAITAYSFVGFTGFAGTVDESAKSIAVTVPFGTNVTALIATFTTTGAGVKVGTTVQTSTAIANNFTAPVAYIVTADDSSTTTYMVSVTIAPNPAKAITAFSFVGFSGAGTAINEPAKTITVILPYGTSDVTNLTATFTTTGTSVKVGSAVQTSTSTANNFTTPKAYTVTAADGTSATYTVTVSVALNPAKAISTYSLAGTAGIINEAAKSVAVNLPSGTVVTNLIATFTTTGADVKVGTALQSTAVTPNDFTQPVAYSVTAADGTVVNYTVTVTVTSTNNPTAPLLGEAGRFVILASQLVSTTAGSVVSNGDIGVEDQARSFMTGFTPVGSAGAFAELANGISYANNDSNPLPYPYPLHSATTPVGAQWTTTAAMITQAKTDLGIAYSFLKADPNPGAPTQVCPTQLGGLTLTPGVYYTAASVLITTGALQLDALGDPNAVWIFSIDGSLTTGAPGGNISFVGGVGKAKNVYWRSSSDTIIGANTTFYGNVFAWTQVNVLTNANVTGRLFALTDQVTLISSTVTKAP